MSFRYKTGPVAFRGQFNGSVDIAGLQLDVGRQAVGFEKLVHGVAGALARSEERRGGEECRSRGSPDH